MPLPNDDEPNDVDADDVDADELTLTAGRLALVIGRLNRRMFRATGGLSHSGLSALSSLVKYGPLRLNELGRLEGVAPATVTRIAVDLENRDFITRTADKHDRRAVTVEASPLGVDYIMQARSARADVMATLLATLDDKALAQLEDSLPVLEALVLEAGLAERA